MGNCSSNPVTMERKDKTVQPNCCSHLVPYAKYHTDLVSTVVQTEKVQSLAEVKEISESEV